MAAIDQTLTYRDIEAKLAQTINPRHRLMLERLLQHARGEVEEDLEAVLATLSPNPRYRVWSGGPEMNPEGFEAVRKFYIEQIFGKGRHCIESNKDRIVVADDHIITEGMLRAILWGQDAQAMRLPADDPEGYYLVTYRMLVVWPYDEDGYIIGEESWSSYPKDFIQKIAESEVPERFRAYVASRRQAVPA
jgi:hypothetical protein